MARYSSASLVIKIFALAAGFLYAVLAARLLGPAGYGQVSVALSAAGVVSTVALLGINGLAVREIASLAAGGAWAELHGYWRWSLVVTSATSLLLAAALAFFSPHAGPYSAVLLIAALMVPVLALARLLRALSQGAGLVVSSQVPIDVARLSVMVLLVGALLLAGVRASAVDVLLIAVGASLLALLMAAFNFRRYLLGAPRAPSRTVRGRQWLVAASPFLGMMLFTILGSEINTLLLGWLAGPREAGLYQPIARIAPIMLIGVEALAIPLAPRLAALWHRRDQAGLARLVHRSTLAAAIVSFFVVSLILLLSPWILAAFGPEFLEYRPFLFLIAAAQLVSAAAGDAALLLAMAGSMRARLAVQALTVVVQVAVGIVLIPGWGAAGAAVALAASILTWALGHWIVALRAISIDTSVLGVWRSTRSG